MRLIAIDQFIELQWFNGWDREFGGLFYFLDVEGHCPVQLEWCNKLWWPHCEALLASLLAYTTTRNVKHWYMFKQCFDYIIEHVSARDN